VVVVEPRRRVVENLRSHTAFSDRMEQACRPRDALALVAGWKALARWWSGGHDWSRGMGLPRRQPAIQMPRSHQDCQICQASLPDTPDRAERLEGRVHSKRAQPHSNISFHRRVSRASGGGGPPFRILHPPSPTIRRLSRSLRSMVFPFGHTVHCPESPRSCRGRVVLTFAAGWIVLP